MPSKNSIKMDIGDSYYHVYARGANKQTIFPEVDDFNYFIKLLKRYLSKEETEDKMGRVYPKFNQKIELLAFCLMGNHFHFLIYQNKESEMSYFMRSLMTSYSKYFNLKYKRTGPLFEGRYKAVRIDSQPYLEHISRYIHLNPRYWKRYQYSSLNSYLSVNNVDWVKTEKILSLFKDKNQYLSFLGDYEGHKEMMEEIKNQLADK